MTGDRMVHAAWRPGAEGSTEPQVVGLHHVQLAMPVGGEEEAIAFYAEVLGLRQVEKPPHLAVQGGCWFEKGPTRIHLGVEEEFRPARKAHPAVLVSSLAGMTSRLEVAGVEVLADQPLPGFDRVYVSDPFGNRLELLEPTEDAASLRVRDEGAAPDR